MLTLKNLKVDINNDLNLDNILIKYLRIRPDELIDYEINKRSIDARVGHNLSFIYEIIINLKDEEKFLKSNKNKNITRYISNPYKFPQSGITPLNKRPIIIGLGPAGLFCAYFLAKHGYKPIVYERGKEISQRIKDVEKFWNESILNENSNVQFGEGGAGTFSDGKLNTQIKDKENRIKEILNIFVKCGAPEEIMYEKNPHIGTDNLRKVVVNLRNKIIDYGGEIHFNSLLKDIYIEGNKIKSIKINEEIIDTELLILATGHSAKDTFEMLLSNGIDIKNKPFAIGIRIVHPQSLINENQYKCINNKLPQASYKLTYNTNNRGIYSFCMCPGGYVVNASSEKGRVVTNGMSNYLRDSGFANSAIIVTINECDYGIKPLDGLRYMENIEKRAYELTQGAIAIQTFKDYENNVISDNLKNTNEFVKGKTINIDINKIFPEYINNSLKEGINYFNTKIKDFNKGIILAPETRTSSPVWIKRTDNLESNILGIYPCGEGSGYAGGITSSAIDGMKVAEEIAKKYKEIENGKN